VPGASPRHRGSSAANAPAWPAHPAWLARFLEALGTRISH
ncbi:protease, partial [Pseudomonas aeruginosa]|nr:protease [Pseudomonas aeruginosa]